MKEIALALGGGGVRGIAHIGVIRRLEKEGFTIRAISGTSAGGMIGAVYAAGFSPDQIIEILKQVDQSQLFSRQHGDGPSLLGLQGVTQALSSLMKDCTFDDLKIPFACTAVDIDTAQEIILTEGRVVDAVLATIAVPGIFPPKKLNGLTLVDGGILDPVPVALARWLAPGLPILAICLTPVPEGWAHISDFRIPQPIPLPAPIIGQFSKMRIGQAFNIFVRSLETTWRMLSELRMQIDQPDIIIRPNVERYGILDFANIDDLVQQGEQAVEQALPEIYKTNSFTVQVSRYFRRPVLPGKIVRTETKNRTKRRVQK